MKTLIIAVSLFLASSLYAQAEYTEKTEQSNKMVCGQLKILLKIIKEDSLLEMIKDTSGTERYVKRLMEYYNCEEEI